MTFRTKQLPYLLVIAALLPLSAISQAETLTETIENTLRTHPEVLSQVNFKHAREQQVKQAESGYYPKADIGFGIGRDIADNRATGFDRDETARRESSIIVKQMLYDGYSTKNAVDRSESLLKSADSDLNDTSLTTALRTVEVYLNVLRNQHLKQAAQDNLDAHKSIFDRIKVRSSSGVGTKVDVEQAQARLSLAKSNLAAADGNLQDAFSNFKQVTGYLPSDIQPPDDNCCTPLPATVEDAVKIAYSKHPSLRASVASHQADLAQRRGADAAFHPKINLEVGADNNHGIDGVRGRDEDAYAMFRMRYNLLNGGADKARQHETDYLSSKSREEAKSTKRDVEYHVRLAWNALQTTQDKLPVLQTYADSAKKTREAYIKQFSLGKRTLLDLLDTENELFQAKSNYIKGQYDRRFACYKLIASMGVLLERLHIKLATDDTAAGNTGKVTSKTAETH